MSRGNGGATSYYELPKNATELKHLIKYKKMEHSIGDFNISYVTIRELIRLGILSTGDCDTRSFNIGKSNYSDHLIQPWSIILDWGLNYWDGDIIKRVLRTKSGESRILDYQKIIHICEERIRQIEVEATTK